VKITPAHDFNDYEVGKRTSCRSLTSSHIDAKVELRLEVHGLDRYVARKQIVADLDAQGLLERVQDHKLMVPRGDRTNAVIEPYLTDQWFVDLTRDVQRTAARGRKAIIEKACVCGDGRIRFVPDTGRAPISTGCTTSRTGASRARSGGSPHPVLYDDAGNLYVARSEAEARTSTGWPRRWRSSRTRTCSTPGSPRRCGRFRPSAAGGHAAFKTFYPTSCWSPASTSSSSGWPA